VLVTARTPSRSGPGDKKVSHTSKSAATTGKNRLMKGAGLAYRALQLGPVVSARNDPRRSHGARSQLLLCNCLRLRRSWIEDYDTAVPSMMKPTGSWPRSDPDSSLCVKNGHLRKYPGIKEDVYAGSSSLTATFCRIGIGESDLVVTARPPLPRPLPQPRERGTLHAFMNRACKHPG